MLCTAVTVWGWIEHSAACAACVPCKDYSALEQSRKLWLALVKASQVRGSAGIPGLRLSARISVNTLISLAQGKDEQQKHLAAEALLRKALSVSHCLFLLHFVNRSSPHWKAAASACTLFGGMFRCQPILLVQCVWTNVFELT